MRQPPHPCYVPELISKEATPFSVIGSLLHLLKVYNYWYCSSTQEGRRGQCGIVFCEIKFPEEGVVLGAMHLYLYVLALLCTFLVEKGWQILHVTQKQALPSYNTIRQWEQVIPSCEVEPHLCISVRYLKKESTQGLCTRTCFPA